MTAHLKEDEAERAHQIATKYAHATMVDACEAEIAAAIIDPDPSTAFSNWINQGPKLAKAAGCYVGITVYDEEPKR